MTLPIDPPPPAKPTGPELVQEMAKHPTLDEFFDRDLEVNPLSEQDIDRLVQRLRAQRAQFVEKGE